MLSAEQADLVCTALHREAEAEASRQRLVMAARLQRRAQRRALRAQRATRRAAQAATQASLAWAQLN
jgi:hypothetical protein